MTLLSSWILKGNNLLSQASIERREQKSRELQERIDSIVLSALVALGGKFEGRVMALRHHLSEPIREAPIKESLKRLEAAGKIKVTPNKVNAHGKLYEIK